MIKLLLAAALFTVATPTEPTITYTSDSVISEGISLNVLETSTEDNIIAKRPGSGISPMRWNYVLGTKAVRDFQEDELIEL